jgi:uncharacterized protein YndB with AHSA1/START domain
VTKSLEITAQGANSIQIVREFDAPASQLFRAYTQPDLVKQWLCGPRGWSLISCEIDLRVGGRQQFAMRHQDGREMHWGGTFQEVVPDRRLVHTEVFSDDWTGGETLVEMEFQQIGMRSRLVQTMHLSSEQARDNALRSGMETGMEASYATLDRLFDVAIGSSEMERRP